MTDAPLVSAIIPVYNGERYLAEAIDSVLRQTYRPVEMIVVDDGSTDRTAAISGSYREVHYLHQKHGGLAVARNTGITATRGALLGFLDHDDRWTPDKLEKQVRYLLDHPEKAYVVGTYELFLDGLDELPWWAEAFERVEGEGGGSIPAMLAWKRAFETVGLFDPGYTFGMDTDWFMRALDAKLPYEILPDVIYQRRIHATNMMHRAQRREPDYFRILHASIHRKRGRQYVNEERLESQP